MAGDVSSAGPACRRYAAGMTRAVRGGSSPEGTADHRQGWSEAQPLLNDKGEAKPRRGDRQDEPSGVPRDCFLSVAPSGLHRPLRAEQGFRFAPPLPVVCRPFGACCVSAAPHPKHRQRSHPTSLVCPTNTANVHIQLRWCALQTPPTFTPNFVGVPHKHGDGVPQTQRRRTSDSAAVPNRLKISLIFSEIPLIFLQIPLIFLEISMIF